jgi:hypothetical protein
MQHDQGTITGHFMSHWGVPMAIYPWNARGIPEFAVLEFGPRPPRMTWRYATNGMSSYAQEHPERNVDVRCEVFCCTRNRASWVNDLLAAVAAYPIDYHTSLADGDTIDVGQPIDRSESPYTGILLSAPSGDAQTLGLVGGLANDILVHQIVGLLPREVDFAAANGGRVLAKRLEAAGELLLDQGRQSVI